MISSDRVDDLEIDVDEDGIKLILYGDFVEVCDQYLAHVDQNELRFRIPSTLIGKLQKHVNSLEIP